MKQIKKLKAIKYNEKMCKEVIEEIVNDKTLTLKINGTIARKFSVIDDSLKEFVIGYLISENYISSLDKIENINISNHKITIDINKEINTKEVILPSDASGGIRNEINKIPKVKSSIKIKASELIEKMENLTTNAEIWKKTGGTHVAGIVYKNQFIVKEDVSRHVAVDKVIGAGILNNFDLNNSYIVFSGRMPKDMVIKLVRANIPILASNTSPTTSGVEIAKKGNITLVGFLRDKRFNVYTNPNKILF